MHANLNDMARRVGAGLIPLVCTVVASAQFVPTAVHWSEPSDQENWISVSMGTAWVDGNQASYQRVRQHDAGGFVGVDAFRYLGELSEDRTWLIDGRVMGGDHEYRIRGRIEDSENGWYVETGFRQSRVFYQASGGFFPPNGLWLTAVEQERAIDRGEWWLEAGLERERWTARLRYSHQYRDGDKDSTSWGESNAVGLPGANRGLVPAFWTIDEERDIFTADLEYRADAATFGGGVRIEDSSVDNSRNTRRRAGEPQDRALTQREQTDTDLFAVHGFTELRRGEKLTVTAAASHLTMDTHLGGQRTYGASYDAVYDPNFSRRQVRDEGFFDLEGEGEWNQTLLTANALYLPAKNWRVTGGVRFEDQSQDVMSDFMETNVASNLAAQIEELAGDSERDYEEVLGTAEVTYTGVVNWVFSTFIEAADGNGDLREELTEPELGIVDISRDTRFDRSSFKYGANARWYPAAGLNFAGGVYRKIRDNDYDTTEDTTPPVGGDRYPAFITGQKFTTDDLYVRGTWRPVTRVSITGRYDYQQTDIESREEGLTNVIAAEMTTHIFATTVTWSPLDRLFVQAGVNYVYDQITTDLVGTARMLAGTFDNNYRTSSLLAIFALDEDTDIQADYYQYRTNNFRDVSAVTMPFGSHVKDDNLGLTYTQRINLDLQWSVRFALGEYEDFTSGGNNNFDYQLAYGRVQFRF